MATNSTTSEYLVKVTVDLYEDSFIYEDRPEEDTATFLQCTLAHAEEGRGYFDINEPVRAVFPTQKLRAHITGVEVLGEWPTPSPCGSSTPTEPRK